MKKVKVRPPYLQTTPISNDSQQTLSDNDEFPPPAIFSEEPHNPGDEENTLQPTASASAQDDADALPSEAVNELFSAASAQDDADTQPSEAVNQLLPSTDEESDAEQPFTVDVTMESRLEQLLEAAADRGHTRVTRSHGSNLQWSSEMNPDNVLQPEEEI